MARRTDGDDQAQIDELGIGTGEVGAGSAGRVAGHVVGATSGTGH